MRESEKIKRLSLPKPEESAICAAGAFTGKKFDVLSKGIK